MRDDGVTNSLEQPSAASIVMLMSTKPFRYVEWNGLSVHKRLLSYLTMTLTWIYHSSEDENDREDIQWGIDIISVENVVTLLGKFLLCESDEIFA